MKKSKKYQEEIYLEEYIKDFKNIEDNDNEDKISNIDNISNKRMKDIDTNATINDLIHNTEDNITKEIIQRLKTRIISVGDRNRLIKNKNIIIKTGRYSKAELDMVEKGFKTFLQQHNLKREDLEKYILNKYTKEENNKEEDNNNESNNQSNNENITTDKSFPIRNLILYFAEILPFRTFLSTYHFIYYFYHLYKNKVWIKEDEIELIRLAKLLDRKWKEIGKELKHESIRCFRRYEEIYKNKSIKNKECTETENKKIMEEYLNMNNNFNRKWISLESKFNISKIKIKNIIIKYLKEDYYKSRWNIAYDIKLIIYIFKYNHILSIIYNRDIIKDIKYMIEEYKKKAEDINSFHKKDKKLNLNKKVDINIDNSKEDKIKDKVKDNVEDNQDKHNEIKLHNTTEDKHNDIKSNDINKNNIKEDKHDDIVNFIKSFDIYRDKLTKSFFDHLNDFTCKYDLDVEIEENEIFWNNIVYSWEEEKFLSNVLKSKFRVLKKIYKIKKFKDMKDTLCKLVVEYALDECKYVYMMLD